MDGLQHFTVHSIGSIHFGVLVAHNVGYLHLLDQQTSHRWKKIILCNRQFMCHSTCSQCATSSCTVATTTEGGFIPNMLFDRCSDRSLSKLISNPTDDHHGVLIAFHHQLVVLMRCQCGRIEGLDVEDLFQKRTQLGYYTSALSAIIISTGAISNPIYLHIVQYILVILYN